MMSSMGDTAVLPSFSGLLCSVAALRAWLALASIGSDRLLQAYLQAGTAHKSSEASCVNALPSPEWTRSLSAHPLRSGFAVNTATCRGEVPPIGDSPIRALVARFSFCRFRCLEGIR